jgi:hypothetical protein
MTLEKFYWNKKIFSFSSALFSGMKMMPEYYMKLHGKYLPSSASAPEA